MKKMILATVFFGAMFFTNFVSGMNFQKSSNVVTAVPNNQCQQFANMYQILFNIFDDNITAGKSKEEIQVDMKRLLNDFVEAHETFLTNCPEGHLLQFYLKQDDIQSRIENVLGGYYMFSVVDWFAIIAIQIDTEQKRRALARCPVFING